MCTLIYNLLTLFRNKNACVLASRASLLYPLWDNVVRCEDSLKNKEMQMNDVIGQRDLHFKLEESKDFGHMLANIWLGALDNSKSFSHSKSCLP